MQLIEQKKNVLNHVDDDMHLGSTTNKITNMAKCCSNSTERT